MYSAVRSGLIVITISIMGIFWYVMHYYNHHSIQNDSYKKIRIVCTTSIIADAVRNIAGNYVECSALMGPGVDPHIYRARASDMRALDAADIIFYNGLHLEGKMADILASMQTNKVVIAVADALKPSELIATEFAGIADPHIWHDVSLWIKVVRYMCAILVKHDPARADIYMANANNYAYLLEQLHAYIIERSALIPIEQRIIVTAHDAFSYCARAYGFTVVGLQGISTDAQISTRDVQNIVHYIIQHKIPVVFIETSLPVRNMEIIQEAVRVQGWNITIGPELYSDALGDQLHGTNTYIGMIKHNMDSIVNALRFAY